MLLKGLLHWLWRLLPLSPSPSPNPLLLLLLLSPSQITFRGLPLMGRRFLQRLQFGHQYLCRRGGEVMLLNETLRECMHVFLLVMDQDAVRLAATQVHAERSQHHWGRRTAAPVLIAAPAVFIAPVPKCFFFFREILSLLLFLNHLNC